MTDATLARLEEDEADLEQVQAASDQASGAAVSTSPEERLDFFVTKDGLTYAGTHLLVDLFGADIAVLCDPEAIETALVEAATSAGATVLNTDFHHFQPNGGVSGVVVLAESHISIHTWPERSFAAVDVFMCGDCRPISTLPILRAAFKPAHVGLQENRRGVVSEAL